MSGSLGIKSEKLEEKIFTFYPRACLRGIPVRVCVKKIMISVTGVVRSNSGAVRSPVFSTEFSLKLAEPDRSGNRPHREKIATFTVQWNYRPYVAPAFLPLRIRTAP